MTTQEKHTAGGLRVERQGKYFFNLIADDGYAVVGDEGIGPAERAQADAARIVQCWNAHDALVEALRGYEAWEADLIMNNSWSGPGGLPTLTPVQYDAMMLLQAKRNAALNLAGASNE